MRRRLHGLQVVRMAFAVSVLEIGYALLLFAGLDRVAVDGGAPWLSTLFLIGGVTTLTLIRYGLTGWRRAVLIGVPVSPLLAIAFLRTGPDNMVQQIVFLTMAIALCALLGHSEQGQPQGASRDLVELVFCFLSLLVGSVMVVRPRFVPAGTFTPLDRFVPALGLLAIIGAVGLLTKERLAKVRTWLPAVARLPSVLLTVILTITLTHNGQYLGGLFNLTWGLALLFRPTRSLARPVHGETLSGDDVLLSVEGSAESWTWLLVVVIVAMTYMADFNHAQHMIPIAYAVLTLIGYVVVAYWLLPNPGRRPLRLLIHLGLLVFAVVHLMSDGSAAAQGVSLMAVVPPMLATRAKGAPWGYGVLGLTAVLLAAKSAVVAPDLLDTAWLAELSIRLVGLLAAGAMVVQSAARQRRLTERLQTAQQELQAFNEELTAQNEELLQAGRELTTLAETDPLTGLINRRRFQEYVAAAVHGPVGGALLFLDLDHFKEINDHLGHAVGDRVLQAVARTLGAEAGTGDVVARLGGDEFAILSSGSDMAAAWRLADRVLQRMRQVEGAGGFPVRASMGITLYPEQGRTVEALLVQADMAMYQVKRTGRNGARFYTGGAEPDGVLFWERELSRALAEERLFLVFQPIMDLKTGEIARYEALLRLAGPDGKVILPGEFLPHVESLPLMDRIDRWVVQTALRAMASYGAELQVAVNLSARAFDDPELPATILRWIAAANVAPHRVIFEITETTAISDLGRANAFIETLRRHGCRFAIDDFGSGFASFSYLRHLRIDYVKIDGQLVQELKGGTPALVEGIVAIARGLKMATIAEWVEDRETLDLLRRCGVDYVQGFLIGHPGALPTVTKV